MTKVLYIAFACEPGKGSEPEVGWNFSSRMADRCQAWILTESAHRPGIEAWLRQNPHCHLRVVYHELPKWQKSLLRLGGYNLHYYLWQRQVRRVAQSMHEREQFDLIHHVTYARYWMPSAARHLNVPYVWGPVGGAEGVSAGMLRRMGWRTRLGEAARSMVRRLFEWHPATRRSIRQAALILAGTGQTARRLRELGAKRVEIFPMIGWDGLQPSWRDKSHPTTPGEVDIASSDGVIRFVSAGRLLYWKGFDLGLRAFAQAKLENARYIIIGDGPQRHQLAHLAARLGIEKQVEFTGGIGRDQCLQRMGQSDVLVHPSLHDSGGYACMEALCMGKPVVCLDVGGPASQINDQCGMKITPGTLPQVIADLSLAMRRLASDNALRLRMGQAAQRHMLEQFTWDRKMDRMEQLYRQVLTDSVPLAACPPVAQMADKTADDVPGTQWAT